MKQEIISKVLYLLLAFVLILGFNVGHAAGQVKKVEWKIQAIYPPAGRSMHFLKEFAEKVEERTGGNFRLKIFMPGQLVGARELFGSVNKGMLDGAYAQMTFFSATVPVMDARYGPYLAANDKELAYLQLETDYLKPVREEAAKHKILFVGAMPSQPGNLCSRKIVRTLAEFRGLKIRGGGVYSDIITALGGSPVSVAPSEMYTALQYGTMDAVFYPLYAAVEYKFYEQLKCVVWPAPLETSADFFVSMDSYNALSPAWQKVLIDSFMEKVKEYAETGDAYTKEQEKYLAKHGVEVITWSETDADMAKKLCMPIREKFRAASPASAMVIAIAEKALGEYRKKHPSK